MGSFFIGQLALQSGLPVWVGFTCKLDENSTVVLYRGELLTDAIAAIGERDVALLNIMHTDVSIIHPCLDVLRGHWHGAIGVYVHTGRFFDGKWQFDGVISPDKYRQHVEEWLARDVRVIGGCCGIGPGHIKHLACGIEFAPPHP